MGKMHLIVLTALVCSAFIGVKGIRGTEPEKPVYIPESTQRTGDAAAGYTYLTTGDYIKCGIPYDFFVMAAGKSKTNYLNREGVNASLTHEYTSVKAANGETLVAPTCLQCH